VTIRALTGADRAALARFTCARLGEPWAEAIQQAIRSHLADQVACGAMSALGLFEGDVLHGVAAWRIPNTQPPVLCRSDIIAVAIRARRQGYGLVLKQAVLDEARAAGAVAVSSIVHRDNTAMLALNRRFGALVEAYPDDPEHCRCMIGPLQASPVGLPSEEESAGAPEVATG
jgi:ribosomal protein S18 acetylase RimI-like enzyme